MENDDIELGDLVWVNGSVQFRQSGLISPPRLGLLVRREKLNNGNMLHRC